ncbi:MAG TPA: YbaK/EbsC family protein [Pirellulales bacterium]|nr:YbaK/EbsC family protein [Pirellulales bacterium]
MSTSATSLSWIRQILNKRHIPFQELHHEQAFTAQEVAGLEHFSGHRLAKVVIAIVDGRPVELVLPASRRVDLDRVRAALSSQEARFASEPEMEQYFCDAEPGAIPPLRRDEWQNVPVVMDETMRVEGEVMFQAGTHTDAVRIHFADWFNLVQPRVERFSVAGAAAHEGGPARQAESNSPVQMEQLFADLLDVLHLQAKEIERLSNHVERHTDRLLEPLQMSTVVSELNALRARLRPHEKSEKHSPQ